MGRLDDQAERLRDLSARFQRHATDIEEHLGVALSIKNELGGLSSTIPAVSELQIKVAELRSDLVGGKAKLDQLLRSTGYFADLIQADPDRGVERSPQGLVAKRIEDIRKKSDELPESIQEVRQRLEDSVYEWFYDYISEKKGLEGPHDEVRERLRRERVEELRQATAEKLRFYAGALETNREEAPGALATGPLERLAQVAEGQHDHALRELGVEIYKLLKARSRTIDFALVLAGQPPVLTGLLMMGEKLKGSRVREVSQRYGLMLFDAIVLLNQPTSQRIKKK